MDARNSRHFAEYLVRVYTAVMHDPCTYPYICLPSSTMCSTPKEQPLLSLRFVNRSDEQLNPNYGRSAIGTERPLVNPSASIYGVST